MNAFSSLLSLVLVTLWLEGCAHKAPVSPIELSDLSPEQQEQLNREALIIASKRLERMVEQAKTSQQSVRYLATDLFLKGNMSLMEGDFHTASVLFKHVADLVPEDVFIQKKYAISLIRMGDLATAQTVLSKIYQQSKEEKVGLILAGVYAGIDQEQEARKVYEEILTKNPQNEDACVFLGKSFAISAETSKAVSVLQNCARKNSQSGMYDYYIGKIFLDQGQIPQAIAAFKKAHQKQPSLAQAVAALGTIYEEREKFEAAIKTYQAHLKKKPADSIILSKIVQVLFLQERYAEVIPYAEKLSDLEPDNLNLKVKLGILYTDAKQYPEAISVFKELLQMAPQSDKVLYYLGAIYQEMNEYSEAIEFFNQIPPSSGLYTDSSVQMANMLSSLAQTQEGKWEDAFLKHVNFKLEELKDMRVEFSVIKSGYFEATSKFKEAMETLMVVQDEKNFSTQHKYYLANLYEKENKFQESTSLIMTIIKEDPKNAHAWNFLGYSLLTRGEDMEKAFEYIQTALKINPEDGYIRDSLGWYYYKKGEVAKALAELQIAFKKVPDDVEILKHLAIIHKELKNYQQAKSYFESALKHAKINADREEILSSLKNLVSERLPASGKID
jgi:tetratricopeptide (TPR) repeat protein